MNFIICLCTHLDTSDEIVLHTKSIDCKSTLHSDTPTRLLFYLPFLNRYGFDGSAQNPCNVIKSWTNAFVVPLPPIVCGCLRLHLKFKNIKFYRICFEMLWKVNWFLCDCNKLLTPNGKPIDGGFLTIPEIKRGNHNFSAYF